MATSAPDPKAVDLYRKALVLLQQHNGHRAEVLLRDAISLEPGPLFVALTRALNILHRYPEAIQVSTRSVELDPYNPDAHFNLTRSLHLNQQYEESLPPAYRCIELDPENADSYVTAAASLYELEQATQCLHVSDAGLAYDAGHLGCQHFRALALAQLGRHEDVQSAIKTFLDDHPNDCYSWTAAGWALYWLKDYPAAATHLREALRLDPQMEWAHEGMGLSLLALRQPTEARRHLEEALRLCPRLPRVIQAIATLDEGEQQ